MVEDRARFALLQGDEVPKPFRLLLVRPSPSAGPVNKLGWHEKAARGQVDSSWFVTLFFPGRGKTR
jgi:hypothetical protein